MAEILNQFAAAVSWVSNLLAFPSRVIGILGMISTGLAYLAGRRTRVFEQRASRADEAMLVEVRAGFASLAASIAALRSSHAIRSSDPADPIRFDAAPSPFSSPAAPLTPIAPTRSPVLSTPVAFPTQPYAARRWATRRALAICSGVASLTTLTGAIGTSTTERAHLNHADVGAFALFTPLFFAGFMLTVIAFVWSLIAALRLRRWGWGVALSIGTLALALFTVFTMPALLILVFAIWGPVSAPAPAVSPRTATTSTMSPTLAHSGAFQPMPGAPYPPRPMTGAPTPQPGVARMPHPYRYPVRSAGSISRRPLPRSMRLMPPIFPGPAQPLYPTPSDPLQQGTDSGAARLGEG